MVAAAASALLLIPHAHALAQVPGTGSLPEGVGTPTVPGVELPPGTPKLPGSGPKTGSPGTGGGSGQAAPAPQAPASSPSPSAPPAPASPDPAGKSPRAKAPRSPAAAPGAPAQTPGRTDAERQATKPDRGRAEGSRAARQDAEAPASASAPAAKDPSEPADISTVARLVDQVSTGALTALAISSVLAAVLSLVWLRGRYTIRTERRRALRDPLTGIGNRLAFEQRLALEWKRARRYARPLGMLLLDVDGLKRMNDTEGHAAGDKLLRVVGERITTDIREPDLGARLAGDEFVVLCPETDLTGMQELGAKLERRLGEAGIRASIGCAVLRDDDDLPDDMVRRADRAMYAVKMSRGGRRAAPKAQLGLATAT